MNLFPLFLSIKVAFLATMIGVLVALPLAWYFTEHDNPLAKLLNSLTSLPLILPPTVLGYYLLVLVGRQSFLGKYYEHIVGHPLVFTWQGAVLAAGIVAFPLLISSIRNSMSQIHPDIIAAARLLGHSEINIFLTIILPLSWRGIISGIALAFARAMGDFGATLMVAGNIPGQTQTMSIAVYNAMMSGNMGQANQLALIMTGFALFVLWFLHRMEKRAYDLRRKN